MVESSLVHDFIENLKTIADFIVVVVAVAVLAFLPLIVAMVLLYIFKNEAVIYISVILEVIWIAYLLDFRRV